MQRIISYTTYNVYTTRVQTQTKYDMNIEHPLWLNSDDTENMKKKSLTFELLSFSRLDIKIYQYYQ